MARHLENLQVQGKYTYTIGRELGQGTFGAVHEAIRKDGVERAMKIVRASSDPLEAFKFAQEAYKTHELQHENIIPVDDLHFFKSQGERYFFFTMPLANQGSLRLFAPKGTSLDPETGVPILAQTAEGIHYGHTQRVIHRDVKPENILLDERKKPLQPDSTYLHVLVSDFGISVYGHDDSSLIKQDFGGTLFYMAPEQFESETRPASDQYGLSVVAYELLTGKRPYDIPPGEQLGTMQRIQRFKQLHQDAPIPGFDASVLQNNPELRRELEKIVRRGMSKNPGERYPSTQAFGQALQKILTESQQSSNSPKSPSHIFPAVQTPDMSPTPTLSSRNTLNEPAIDDREEMIAKLLRLAESQTGDREKALEIYREALKLNPTHFDALVRMGQVLGRLKRYPEAIAVFDSISTSQIAEKSLDEIINYKKVNAQVFLLYSNELINQGQFVNAVNIYDDLISFYNKRPLENDYKIGEEDWMRLFENEYREIYKKKAFTLSEMGLHKETLAATAELFHFESVVYPKGNPARRRMVLDIEEIDKVDRLDKLYRHMRWNGMREEMIPLQYDTLMQLGRYTEALAVYDICMNIFNKPELLAGQHRALLLEKAEKYEEAVEEFDKDLAEDPTNTVALAHKGNCLLILRKYPDAEQVFEELTQQTPTDGNAWRCKGIAYENQHKYPEALAAYDEALRLMPINKGLLTRKMEVLTQLQRPEEALAISKQIQDLPKK